MFHRRGENEIGFIPAIHLHNKDTGTMGVHGESRCAENEMRKQVSFSEVEYSAKKKQTRPVSGEDGDGRPLCAAGGGNRPALSGRGPARSSAVGIERMPGGNCVRSRAAKGPKMVDPGRDRGTIKAKIALNDESVRAAETQRGHLQMIMPLSGRDANCSAFP